VHHLRFHDEPRALVAGSGSGSGSGDAWVVCGEPSDGARALADALGGNRARLVHPVNSGENGGEDPDACVWLEALRAGDPPEGVAFVAPCASAGLAAQRRGLLALTALVKACTALAAPPRLVIVTANAQAATPGDQPDPGAALYWGLVRVARREHAELQPLLVDVAPADAGWAADCAAELGANDGEDQVVLRAGRRTPRARRARGWHRGPGTAVDDAAPAVPAPHRHAGHPRWARVPPAVPPRAGRR
jgi:phthiocerol/phenolphthiocerol synthesis type-I polyketide synthase C